jgi:hypothetical protein
MSNLTPPLRWLISCDESGMHGGRYYGFGSLWMPYQRRGDFLDIIRQLRARHRYRDEFKWSNIGPASVPAYVDLVDLFFRTHSLAFHCIVYPTNVVRRELHKSRQEMHQKHFTLLLTDKIRRCRRIHRNREQTFRVWVDPLPNRYTKAHEVVQNVANAVLRSVFGKVRPVDGVTVIDSKDTPSVQLCDVLLGAVMAAWQGKTQAADKREVQRTICDRLGWPSLRWDTKHTERKFNVWMFHDEDRGVRTATTRDVVLRYPLPNRSVRQH